MRVRVAHFWETLQSSLWFIPSCMSIAAVLMALLTHQLDKLLSVGADDWSSRMLYSGDLDGARTLLSTVAGSVITVAGVTFSVTMVALSLASSQFGPRLLVNFMRDRSNQLVLGTFIGTFLFCLVAMGGSASADIPGFVPAASATVGLLLAMTSMAMLVYFIHNISSSIRAENIIADTARDLEKSMDRLLARRKAEQASATAGPPQDDDATPGVFIHACEGGYVQAVDDSGLVEIACADDLCLRVLRRPGQFVVEGDRLVGIMGGSLPPPSSQRRIQECFILGRWRTGEQDPEYWIHQLVEVAVRALSPGVNDPYTAVTCVDWLGAILCSISDEPLPSSRRYDAEGQLRLVGDAIAFAGLVEAAFDQIRQSAGSTPAVSLRLLETLANIGRHVRMADRRPPIREQADMTYRAAIAQGLQERDRQDLEERYEAVTRAIGR